jgi:hypothetical protein
VHLAWALLPQLSLSPGSPEAVAELDPAVRGRLRDAVEAVDLDGLLDLLSGFEGDFPEIVEGLRKLADDFDFEGLTELLSELVLLALEGVQGFRTCCSPCWKP